MIELAGYFLCSYRCCLAETFVKAERAVTGLCAFLVHKLKHLGLLGSRLERRGGSGAIAVLFLVLFLVLIRIS